MYIYNYNDPPAIVLAMSSQQLLPPQLGPMPSCKLRNLPHGRCGDVENGDLHPDFSGKPRSEWKYYGICSGYLT